ncbi:MAG: ATP-binding cassette domain-containing protein [Candidatus Omnitrophica bacterium]|nr:ATP-binding cassette domain-containing protein [Candidatus Omnitrophota bacterium]
MAYVIDISRLTKEFIPAKIPHHFIVHLFKKQRPVLAINKVSLQIKKGDTFALVGPNGAGKTTLIKILSGLILPTKGRAKVAGYDILDEKMIKVSVGLVSGDERSFYWRLTLWQTLSFFLHFITFLLHSLKVE